MWTSVALVLPLGSVGMVATALMSGLGFGHWDRAAVQSAGLPVFVAGLIYSLHRRKRLARNR